MNLHELFSRLTMGRAIILGFLATSLYYFMIFDDGTQVETAIQSNEAQMAQVNQELKSIQEKMERAQDYQRATSELGNSIKKLLSYIPAQFRIGQLMKMVSDEARISGLDIVRMTPKTVAEPNRVEDFTELGTSMELKGQFDQLLKFMSNLTKKRQIFIFEKLDIKSGLSTAEDQGDMIQVNAEIHAFSYNRAENSGL